MWEESINLGIICIKVIIKTVPEITQGENAEKWHENIKRRVRLNYDQ